MVICHSTWKVDVTFFSELTLFYMCMWPALLSVSDKRGLVEFAKRISDLGVELLGSGGTAAAVTNAGIKIR